MRFFKIELMVWLNVPYSRIFKNHKLFVLLYSTVGEGNYFACKRFDLQPQWLKNNGVIEYFTKKPKQQSKAILQNNCSALAVRTLTQYLWKIFLFWQLHAEEQQNWRTNDVIWNITRTKTANERCPSHLWHWHSHFKWNLYAAKMLLLTLKTITFK